MGDFIQNSDGSLTRVAGPDGRKTVRTGARAVETKMTDLMIDSMMRRDFDPSLAAYIISGNDEIQEPLFNFIVAYLMQITIGGGDPEIIAKARKMLQA